MKLKEPLQGIKILQGFFYQHICCAIIMIFFVNRDEPNHLNDDHKEDWKKTKETFWWMLYSHIVMATF